MGGDNVQLSAGANPGQRIRVRCAIRIMVGRGEIVRARKGGDNVRLSETRWLVGARYRTRREMITKGGR